MEGKTAIRVIFPFIQLNLDKYKIEIKTSFEENVIQPVFKELLLDNICKQFLIMKISYSKYN